MRQRNEKDNGTAQQPAAPASSPAAAAAARAAAKRSSTQKSRLRGFWIGTGGFLVCLLLYICFRGTSTTSPSSSSTATSRARAGLRVTERDVVALGLATQQVDDLATLPGFEELSKTAARIGTVYLALLEQVAAAAELEDGGHALRQLDVSEHHLTSVAEALHRAADVSYTKLKRMLLREPHAELALAPTSLVRTMYGWMLSDLFLYSAVLPEYYLYKDDTPSHALALLRATHVLSWTPLVHTGGSTEATTAETATRLASGAVLTQYDLFNWSGGGGGAACRKGPLGSLSKNWMQFCESSFSSTAAVARRAAATYEELIVLYPTYAPLRLHYAVGFAFLGSHALSSAATAAGASLTLSDHAMKALRVVRNDRTKVEQGQYKHADALHLALLTLLEAYLSPVDLWTSEQRAQLVRALGELRDCAHVQATLLSPQSWRGEKVFEKEYRVPLLTTEQWRFLLTKAQVHLGADHAALAAFHACL